MLRLSDTYQIDLPLAFEASKGFPGGFHLGACEYWLTSFWASAIPSARDSMLVAPALLVAASTPTAPAPARMTALRARLRETSLRSIASPPLPLDGGQRAWRLPASRENARSEERRVGKE